MLHRILIIAPLPTNGTKWLKLGLVLLGLTLGLFSPEYI
jgi:hypothetical protein